MKSFLLLAIFVMFLIFTSELKRRQKAEREAKKKADKLAAKAAQAAQQPAEARGKAFADEDPIDPSKYFENREKLLSEAAAKGLAIYPHKFHTTISVPDFIAKYSHLSKGEQLKEETVSLAGRILRKHGAGSKLVFYDLRGDGATLQILSDARAYEGEDEFKQIHNLLRRGVSPPPKAREAARALAQCINVALFFLQVMSWV